MSDLPFKQERSWLKTFFLLLAIFLALALLLAAPVSGLWLYMSGDVAVGRAVEAQEKSFALFGSSLNKTTASNLEYKLALYRAKKPVVVVAGSAGMESLRDTVFLRPMVNMAGTADSLSTLRESLDAMLAIHKPAAVILAVDWWWFSPAWEKDPFARHPKAQSPYEYSLDNLRLPWRLFLQGQINLGQFLFLGFSEGRYGAHAQFDAAGLGPDGSRHSTKTLVSSRSEDAEFARTLDRRARHVEEFATCETLSQPHLDALADIYFRLRGRGVVPIIFISPMAGPVLESVKEEEALYPHLFKLREALASRGIEMANTLDPAYFGAGPCEFLDGTHIGEIGALRILSELTRAWNDLLPMVDMERMNRAIAEWKDHAAMQSPYLPGIIERDFLNLSCVKRTGLAQTPIPPEKNASERGKGRLDLSDLPEN